MYDLAVIGLGPAGLEAVDIALKNNLKVIAFEKNELGGTCLNVGCIPTKTIIHSANLLKEMSQISKLGLSLFSAPGFDWQGILDRKIEIVNKFNKLLNSSLSKNITLINAQAELFMEYDKLQIYADDNIYEAKNIIVATGSVPFEIEGLEFDGKFILNSDDIFKMQKLPQKMLIIGSGAIGLEWSIIMANLGVEVKLVEKAPNLAPALDIDLQKRVERILKQNKIQYYKNDYVTSLSNDLVTLNSGVSFDTDCILVAVGRKPNLPLITISGVNEKYIVKADEFGRCDIENLYVAGDALNKTMLAHAASFQARNIMNYILFNKNPIQKNIPSVIYTSPEIASVGLREQDISDKEGYEIKKILISSIAKSWCDDCSDGLVKVIIKDGLILGAHVVSKEASALITIFNILIEKQVKTDEIADMIFPHPSFAEAVSEVIKHG